MFLRLSTITDLWRHQPCLMPRYRLDLRLYELGLTPSREQARRLIMAGEVLVNGQVVDKPATPVAEHDRVELRARPRFVSRGGEKLDAALSAFALPARGLVCRTCLECSNN